VDAEDVEDAKVDVDAESAEDANVDLDAEEDAADAFDPDDAKEAALDDRAPANGVGRYRAGGPAKLGTRSGTTTKALSMSFSTSITLTPDASEKRGSSEASRIGATPSSCLGRPGRMAVTL
jgi:hypothetical protein